MGRARVVFSLLASPLAAGAIAVLAASSLAPAASGDIHPRHGLEEVGHERVEMVGGFWAPRLKTHHEVTIPHALDALEKDGHVTNFDKAAGVFDGALRGHGAFDSDLYKALEGAVYSLKHFPDPALSARVDKILDRIIAAQQKDGFLIAYHIVNGLDKRWDDLRLGHQMYNAGHYFELAAAHAQLTGDTKILDSAKRFADHIDSIFGINKRYDVDGHQEVELALVKLYRATGERKYLDLAKFFLDERGHVHGTERKPFDPRTQPPLKKPEGSVSQEQQREFWRAQLRYRNGRMQDHKPVVDQHEAIGHAVRAGYMYAAMADMVRFMDAPGFEEALDDIWSDVVGRKMYVTGNIGTGQYGDEGFGDPYLLPNESAYCETCAAIAHVLWQHRMNLLKGQAKYADVMELTLYNGVLPGISLAGDRFFYTNPLASKGTHQRRPWIGLSCCPTNMARIIPQVGGLVYARGRDGIYVNLYAAGEASVELADGATVKLAQQTEYPWEGRVRLTVTPAKASQWTLALRIPLWAQGRPVPSDLYRFTNADVPPVTLKVNGQSADAKPGEDGYARVTRTWTAGDVVELDLPMRPQVVVADSRVKDDLHKVALMRGPIVYCLEAVDNPDVDVIELALSKKAKITSEHRAELLGGVTVLKGEAIYEGRRPTQITAIPYYAWQNRGKSAMMVWIQEANEPAQPTH